MRNYIKYLRTKEESGLGKDFHYLSGYYETDDWVEAT